MRIRSVLMVLIAVLGACSGGATTTIATAQSGSAGPTTTESRSVDTTVSVPDVAASDAPVGQLCASVIDAEATKNGDTWTFALTVRSDDISTTEFGDSWELRTLEGEVIATRVLAHEHMNEQPFTRSMSGIVIPEGITTVIGVAHHSVGGYCGETLEIELP